MLLVLIGSGESLQKNGKSNKEEYSYKVYEKETEERISELVSSLDGVSGGIKIMVVSKNSSAEGERPDIEGVAIVCRANSETKLEIVNLVSSALGISSARIFVGSLA